MNETTLQPSEGDRLILGTVEATGTATSWLLYSVAVKFWSTVLWTSLLCRLVLSIIGCRARCVTTQPFDVFGLCTPTGS